MRRSLLRHYLNLLGGILLMVLILGSWIGMLSLCSYIFVLAFNNILLKVLGSILLFLIVFLTGFGVKILFTIPMDLIGNAIGGIRIWVNLRRKGKVLYLRSFHKDGQDISRMYNSGENDELISEEATGEKENIEAEDIVQSFNQFLYGTSGVKAISKMWGTGINNEIFKAVMKVGKFQAFYNNRKINPGPTVSIIGHPVKWREQLINEIFQIDLIIYRPGVSNAILWELGELKKHVPSSRIIIFFASDGWGDLIDEYQLFKPKIEEILNIKFPETHSNPNVIIFDEVWRPSFIYDRYPKWLRIIFLGAWSANIHVLTRALRKLGYPYRRITLDSGFFIGLSRFVFLMILFLFFLKLIWQFIEYVFMSLIDLY